MTIELDTTNNKVNVPLDLKWAKTQGAWMAARSGDPIRGVTTPNHGVPEELRRLAEAVLRIGGSMVCIPFGEDLQFCNLITEFGKEIVFGKVILKKEDISDCHRNSFRLWKKSPEKLKVVMGFGLTDSDQIWRIHTWLLDNKSNLIETTIIRAKYFGFVTNEKFNQAFCEAYGL